MNKIKETNKKNITKEYFVKTIKFIIPLVLIYTVLWTSCARQGSLSGGDKDTVPPVMIGSNPAEKTAEFDGDKITIVFDEYFQLKELNNVFLSSPPLNEKPVFKLRKRSLVIKLKEELLDTSTYTFSFGDAIEDYHENNPLKDFKFVFSTGAVVDSFAVEGLVMDAFSGEAGKDMYVMIYNQYNDSTPLKEKPYFIARTDTSGLFKIDYIKPGKYRIFALKDVDANLLFNLPNEEIAYTDTFIVPKVTEKITIDSLKAGTILHYPNDTLRVDTLKHDSVIITKENIYTPKNIFLFKFTEDKKKQYITQNSRPVNGECIFEFNKHPDSLQIKNLDNLINTNNLLIEKSDTGKVVTYWLKDSTVYQKDTLKFAVSYYNKDSTDNLILETDTFNFTTKVDKDSLQKKYLDLNFKEEEEHFFFNDYNFETKYPITNYDTSKIQLYEIIDTLVLDPKKQELVNYQRQNPSKLFFTFKRPIVKDFNLRLLNIKTDKSWYTVNFGKNKDSVICNITDSLISQKDTLKLIVHYDNDFFLNQVQQFEDTAIMPLTKQKVLAIERKNEDTLKITYNKPLLDIPELNVLDTEYENWYKTVPANTKNIHLIKITDPNVALIDTIELGIKSYDDKNLKGEDNYFTDTTFAIYIFVKQSIKKAERNKKNQFSFVFNKPLYRNIELNPLNFTINNKWFKRTFNKYRDTVTYDINDDFVIKLDTLKLEAVYAILTRDKKTVTQVDTVSLHLIKRERAPITRDNEVRVSSDEKENVSIDVKIPFKFKKDSIKIRSYIVSYPWKGDKSYKLKIDSVTFNDIFGYYNKRTEKIFNVKGEYYFGKLQLSISNVKNISKKEFYTKIFKSDSVGLTDSTLVDSTIVDSLVNNNIIKTDSIENSVLPKGKIILQLFNKDNKLEKTETITKDSILIFDMLAPGDYVLKLIYDINDNGKWDTGDYLKGLKPERTLIYKDGLTIKSKWETQADWIIRFER